MKFVVVAVAVALAVLVVLMMVVMMLMLGENGVHVELIPYCAASSLR